jgi:hypothetical protein
MALQLERGLRITSNLSGVMVEETEARQNKWQAHGHMLSEI